MVDCGYQATHLLTVLDGCIQPHHSRRINIGGGYVDWYLQRLLQLKYPCHVNAITMSRVEVGNFCMSGKTTECCTFNRIISKPEFFYNFDIFHIARQSLIKINVQIYSYISGGL